MAILTIQPDQPATIKARIKRVEITILPVLSALVEYEVGYLDAQSVFQYSRSKIYMVPPAQLNAFLTALTGKTPAAILTFLETQLLAVIG